MSVKALPALACTARTPTGLRFAWRRAALRFAKIAVTKRFVVHASTHGWFARANVLFEIKQNYPDLPIVALTDAPRYVAMWKLNKLGLLEFFDAVYGLADPRVPTCDINRRIKVDPEILLKHLQQSNFGFKGKIRILPDEYEKPGVRGLKTVLMDYEMDESADTRASVLWIGDNLRKDVGLGNRLGVVSAWARYGTLVDEAALSSLMLFSPPQNIHKNVFLNSNDPSAPKPNLVLDRFSDLLPVLALGENKK